MLQRAVIVCLCVSFGLFGLPVQGQPPQVAAGSVIIASTTSTANTGLLDYLADRFKADTGIEMRFLAVGSGMALKHGENGDVDAVLAHAPEAEEQFIAAGYGVTRVPIMWNDFVVVGPPGDSAHVKGAKSVAEAFQRVAAVNAPFVSRGDDSGTHKKELEIWKLAGVSERGSGYVEAGQGMSACLTMANEKQAYILSDRGTWLAMRKNLSLGIAFENDSLLLNPYSIIQVSPRRYPERNHSAAKRLIEWLTSEHGQRLIADYRKDGAQLFHPVMQPPKP